MWLLIQTAPKRTALRDPEGAADVPRPDRGREPVAGAVGPLDRLGLVVEPLHGHHRAEDLVLDHLVVLLEVGDHGRLEVEAGAVGVLAAGDDLRVVGLALEEAADALALDARRSPGPSVVSGSSRSPIT